MLRFGELQTLRDRLVNSLMIWGVRSKDGFYRSSPTSQSTPSFTNTGMVLQAFLESRNFHLAHDLADRLIVALSGRHGGIFPHEKALASDDGHSMCNAWASFSLLDTFPNRLGELSTICDWFLESQREDGSWSLFPGEKTHEPIVTGYVVSALQQFHRCALQLRALGKDSVRKEAAIARSIELAVSYLQDSRPEAIRQQGLYLWSASLGFNDRRPLSLGTSALCMHVLKKWGQYRGRPELVEGVAATFKRLVSGFGEHSDLYLDIGGQRLSIWDQLHFNEGNIHYMWYFFAPITIVTMLSLGERAEFSGDPAFLRFLTHFISWITENACLLDDGTLGIRGGETLADAKVWSTAQSVIVLSRLLDRRHLVGGHESPEGSAARSGEAPVVFAGGLEERSRFDVFLSYSSADKDQARILFELIGARGLSAFLSEKNIKPGDSWDSEIRRALVDCSTVLVLMTPNSVKSKWVLAESSAAWFFGKKVVPVLFRCGESDLPDHLRMVQAVDFHDVSKIVDGFLPAGRT